MTKGEAFLKHMTKNHSVTLKKWVTLSSEQKGEFNEELNIVNMLGDITVDVFGDELKKGSPVYEFKGIKAYCIVGNFAKLTSTQKKQFKEGLAVFPGPPLKP